MMIFVPNVTLWISAVVLDRGTTSIIPALEPLKMKLSENIVQEEKMEANIKTKDIERGNYPLLPLDME